MVKTPCQSRAFYDRYQTKTSIVRVCPSTEAVIIAFPEETAVTTPEASTVAIFVSEELQVTEDSVPSTSSGGKTALSTHK